MAVRNVQILTLISIQPQSTTGGAVNGNNSLGKPNTAVASMICSTSAATGAPTSLSVVWKLQDSADGTTFADVVAPFGALPFTVTQTVANSSVSFDFRPVELRNFLRAVATVAFVGGTTPAVTISAAVATVNPEYAIGDAGANAVTNFGATVYQGQG